MICTGMGECCRCYAATLRTQDNKEILKKSRSISSCREALSKSGKPQAGLGEGGWERTTGTMVQEQKGCIKGTILAVKPGLSNFAAA